MLTTADFEFLEQQLRILSSWNLEVLSCYRNCWWCSQCGHGLRWSAI